MSSEELAEIIQEGRTLLVDCLSMKDPRSIKAVVKTWSNRAYAYCIHNKHTRAAEDVYYRDDNYWYDGLSDFLNDIRRHFEQAIGTLEYIQNPPAPLPVAVKPSTRKVFLIYGHDDALRIKVRECLTRLKFEPIDIGEKPGGGLRSILEKFKDNAETAGFAVALLTADDIGGKHGDELKPRGRQNVILEIGYFIGRLGADRICVICKTGVEIPSDLAGQNYLHYEDWKLSLCDELEKAGYEVDRNLLKNT